MADSTPSDASLSQDFGDVKVTPLDPNKESVESDTDVVVADLYRHYLLTRGDSCFEVLQYSSDIEVTQTIDSLLNFCKDAGWQVKTPGK